MERKPKSLQQMFNDAQDIQHNIQACEHVQKKGLDAQGHESEYEQKIVNWNLEHKINNVMVPLEAHDCAKNYIPLVNGRGDVLAYDPSHDKQWADHFIYSFVDSQENEFVNQSVEEHINVPSLFLSDDLAYDVDLPVYDKYEDDHNIEDFFFSSTVSSKVLDQLKRILYPCALLHSNY
jgi:hypothetical protein